MPSGKKGAAAAAAAVGGKGKLNKSSESYKMAEFLSGFVCYTEVKPELPKKKEEEERGGIQDKSKLTDASDSNAGAGLLIAKPKREYCGYEGCRKTCDSECVHKHCFACCCLRVDDTFCTCHGERKKKIEDENKFIEEMLFSNSKRAKTSFYHFEERFMKYGDTIVIWCMSDFCANRKEWSGDTFAHLESIRKRELLYKRRNNYNDSGSSNLESGSAGSNRIDNNSTSTNNRRRNRVGGGYVAKDKLNNAEQEGNDHQRVKRRRFKSVSAFKSLHDELFKQRLGGAATVHSGLNPALAFEKSCL